MLTENGRQRSTAKPRYGCLWRMRRPAGRRDAGAGVQRAGLRGDGVPRRVRARDVCSARPRSPRRCAAPVGRTSRAGRVHTGPSRALARATLRAARRWARYETGVHTESRFARARRCCERWLQRTRRMAPRTTLQLGLVRRTARCSQRVARTISQTTAEPRRLASPLRARWLSFASCSTRRREAPALPSARRAADARRAAASSRER